MKPPTPSVRGESVLKKPRRAQDLVCYFLCFVTVICTLVFVVCSSGIACIFKLFSGILFAIHFSQHLHLYLYTRECLALEAKIACAQSWPWDKASKAITLNPLNLD